MEANGKRKHSSYDKHSVDYVISSKMDYDTFSFQWSLTNFKTLKFQDEILSPLFQGGPKAQHSWQLIVEPQRQHYKEEPPYDSDDDTDTPPQRSFSVRLRLTQFGSDYTGSKVKASFITSILGPNDNLLLQPVTHREFHSYEPMTTSKRHILVTSYLDEHEWNGLYDYSYDERMDPYVFEDTVKLHCRIWIQHGVKHKSESFGLALETPKDAKLRRLDGISKDFQSGFEANSYTDVSLITSTKTFRAHKFVLTSRSPVFRTMFEAPMVEAADNSVNIDDFDEETVNSMLKYMYTGEAPLESENAMTVFEIADKYELLGLKRDCLDLMGHDLKVETAMTTLALAILHDAVQLKHKVFNLIHRNKEILNDTEEFKDFFEKNPKVLLELYNSQISTTVN